MAWQKPKTVEFPFEVEHTKLLGKIYKPMVTVSFWSVSEKRWQAVKMILDTGADFSLLPKYLADWLGLDIKSAKAESLTEGIGGTQKVVLLEGVKVKVGSFERTVTMGVITNSRVPPILGRYTFLETFKVQLEYHRRVVIKE